ncbi:MAG: TetR/AcrR family transcriptional regulator [Lactovum sp.]
MAKDTKQILLRSFLELLEKKGITQITETDLAKASGVTRFTIQNNFGKNFAKTITDYLYDKISKNLLDKLSHFDPEDMTIEIFADILLPIVWKYQTSIRIIANSSILPMSDTFLFAPFFKWAEPLFSRTWEQQKKTLTQFDTYDMYCLWVQQIILYIVMWIRKPVPEDPKLFKKTFCYLLRTSAASLIDKD